MDLTEEIKKLIEKEFCPERLNVYNDSHKHAGHREAGQAINSHFRVEIDKGFIKGGRIEKHRAINGLLAVYMNNPIHALEIKLL